MGEMFHGDRRVLLAAAFGDPQAEGFLGIFRTRERA